MFDLINALLWIALSTKLGDSPPRQKEIGQQVIVVKTETEYQQNPILCKDYVVAKRALDKAVSERDAATLRLGLKKGSPFFKKEIVLAVRNAWFQSFVPDLITVLEENQISTSANKGNISERNELKKAVVAALRHLTGLPFPIPDELSISDLGKILEESREWYRVNGPEIQQTVIAEMVERQQATPILSKNYNVAKWAFDKAVSENDTATIRLGLKRESLSFRTLVIQAIKKFDDKSFVLDLIKALQDNQVIMSGGSETQTEQQELNKEIIGAIRQLTGLEFPYITESSTVPCFSDCPSKDIERILMESRKWREEHKLELKNSNDNR